MRRVSQILFLFVLISLTIIAQANSRTSPEQNKFRIYIETNLGTNITNVSFSGISSRRKSFNTFAWNVNLGYQFLPNIAAEVGYSQLTTSPTLNLLDLVAKATVPVAKNCSLFGKLGAGFWFNYNRSNNSNQAALLIGGGSEYRLSQRVAINVQLIGVLSQFTSTGLLTAGAAYYF